MELINLNNVMATLEEYAIAVRNKYQDKLIENDRIASGDLLNSIEYKVIHNGSEYEVQLTLEKYWKYLELGISGTDNNTDRPFEHTTWGAYKSILEWVTIKPVLPKPKKNGRLPSPKTLAGAITSSLIKNGIEPGNELRDSLQSVNEEYKEKLVIALHKDMETIMKVLVGDFKGSVPTDLKPDKE